MSVGPARALRRDVKCLGALAAMRLALSLRGYAAIRAGLPEAPPTRDGHFYARQLARRITRLARLVPGASCLTQALALQYLLARAGHGCTLHIGVKRDAAGQFAAHAWVSCNGRIVLGAEGTRLGDYTALAGAR
ncbi:lasso peptide biosynthesis B2 protein [Erythrobacter sp.]|uniref:lasso peptide biosynthesis B2 protein n=1 Tax=Erythrobacter sp. TaxID=1042 RepID=UPI0025CF9ADD|nr:lasso peptide biosynthesis B2 protein [Erythrobacter sp.]